MATKVPFVDLTRIHAPIKDQILQKIGSIIDRSAFVLGPEVEEFEKQFAAFVGSPHCVGVNSGLDALKLALQALQVGQGDEVIVPANTFIATALAASALGAKIVLVDAETKSYNMDPGKLKDAITPRTKAILPVHLYGQPADMGPIMEIAKARGIPVVEDVAQAHGSQYEGKTTGTFGAISCFSFYPGKNLGSIGEGGAVVTADEKLRDRVRVLRNVGQREKYHHELLGHNSRLHTVQAAVLSVKLPLLKAQNEQRARTAMKYHELLSSVVNSEKITVPNIVQGRTHVFHLYVITCRKPSDRDALQKHLGAEGIQTGIHYPIPVHLSSCYSHLGYRAGSFPVTETLANSCLSLPIFAGMTDEEVGLVGQSVRKYFGC